MLLKASVEIFLALEDCVSLGWTNSLQLFVSPRLSRVSVQMPWKYTLGCRFSRMMTGKTSTKCSNCGIGKTNVIYERYRFNNRSQESDESIDAYTTALRTFAETCEHPSVTDPVESLSPPGFGKAVTGLANFPLSRLIFG